MSFHWVVLVLALTLAGGAFGQCPGSRSSARSSFPDVWITTLESSLSGEVRSTSPGVSAYENSAECAWEIRVWHAYQVILEFFQLDTEQDKDVIVVRQCTGFAHCLTSFVEGTASGTSVTEAWPNNGLIVRYMASVLQIRIEFTSDTSTVRPGFVLRYTFSKCPLSGDWLTTATGVIEDGGIYSDNFFGKHARCHWVIQPTHAASVEVTIETMGFSARHSLKFSSMACPEWCGQHTLLGTEQGSSISSSNYSSTTGTMLIELENTFFSSCADCDQIHAGFRLTYETICKDGYSHLDGECRKDAGTPCPAGEFEVDDRTCKPCSDLGVYKPIDAAWCVNSCTFQIECPAAHFEVQACSITGNNQCASCSPNCNSAQSSTTNCSTQVLSKCSGDCATVCLECSEMTCPSGQRVESCGSGSHSCGSACVQGYVWHDGECTCPPGYGETWSGGSRCSPCYLHSYKSNYGADSCSQCPSGTTTQGKEGSTSRSDCMEPCTQQKTGRLHVWTDLSSPLHRTMLAMAAWNGVLYVFGGSCHDEAGGFWCRLGALNDLHGYTIATRSWTDLSSPSSGTLPHERYSHSMVAWDGVLYVFGGSGNPYFKTNDLHSYTIATQAWTDLSSPSSGNPPPGRRGHAMVAWNGMLYIFGDGEGSSWPWNSFSNDLHSYSITARTWTDLNTPSSGFAPLVTSSWFLAMTVWDGVIYVKGSRSVDFHSYSIASREWEELGTAVASPEVSMLDGFGYTVAALNNVVYVFVRADQTNRVQPWNRLYGYSIESHEWSDLWESTTNYLSLPSPSDGFGAAAAVLDGIVYVLGSARSLHACAPCEACAAWKYMLGCNSTSPRNCAACEECRSGEFTACCGDVRPGFCQTCATTACGSGEYLDACGGNDTGRCRQCGSCPQGVQRVECRGTSEGRCETCPAGTFKDTVGTASCSDCSCDAGTYLAECSRHATPLCPSCVLGTFKTSVGSHACTECEGCSSGSIRVGCMHSRPGQCSEQNLEISFTAGLLLSEAEFESKRSEYVAAVATVCEVLPASVTIEAVSRLRRSARSGGAILTTTVQVSTTVSTSTDKFRQLQYASTLRDELLSELEDKGINLQEFSVTWFPPPATTTPPPPDQTGSIMDKKLIFVICVIISLPVPLVILCVIRRRRAKISGSIHKQEGLSSVQTEQQTTQMRCSTCQGEMKIPDGFSGALVKCPTCSADNSVTPTNRQTEPARPPPVSGPAQVDVISIQAQAPPPTCGLDCNEVQPVH